MMSMRPAKRFEPVRLLLGRVLASLFILVTALVFGYGAKLVSAQTSPSVLYIPLIGITTVPDPSVLPAGPGTVTYHYAVKNFLQGVALSNVQVVDDSCSPVKFVEGDDNGNGELDYSETWRYACATRISATTHSVATAVGTANTITATHKAYATVVVGSANPSPQISIINTSQIAYPLSLPLGGGPVTFTYRVTNPGVVPVSDVAVVDDACGAISNKLGDVNGNGLLDIDEVWIYTCTVSVKQTTTNTATVSAFANGLKATDSVAVTVTISNSPAGTAPSLPATGTNPDVSGTVWEILSGVLAALIITFFIIRMIRKKKRRAATENLNPRPENDEK